MKVFAVIPALLVLVSLCGNPVPPPPGTVTGSVYYDANRNGIRDSCDSPMMRTKVVVAGQDGKQATAETDESGAFTVTDAPVGGGTVTLFAPEPRLWPITTAPRSVRVESLKSVSGVEIGTASRSVYDSDRMSISGIVFEDLNANGEVDPDECPLGADAVGIQVRSGDRLAIVRPDGTYEFKNLPEGHDLEVLAGYSNLGIAPVDVQPPLSPLRPTSGVPGPDLCTYAWESHLRYGSVAYEANIGFTHARGSGTITGIAFEDTNGDGQRGEGEALVTGAWVRLYSADPCTVYDKEWADDTNGEGEFTLEHLFPGEYVAQVDINPLAADFSIFRTLAGGDRQVTVAPNGETALTLPIKVGPPGSVRVIVFDDNDADGLRGPGESTSFGITVCARMGGPPYADYYSPGWGSCDATDEEGIAVIETLPEGNYVVSINWSYGGLDESPESTFAFVNSGEETYLSFPLDLELPEEQVIPSGEGRPLDLDICQSDPDWVQPDFDTRWSESLRQLTGFDEATARLIYWHGIYQNQPGEIFTWARLSGFPVEFDPGCSYGVTYVIVGFEPLDVMTTDRVSQLRLRRTGAGVHYVVLPDIYGNEGLAHLFVDEDYVPIVRCSTYCEWRDATAPIFRSGISWQ